MDLRKMNEDGPPKDAGLKAYEVLVEANNFSAWILLVAGWERATARTVCGAYSWGTTC